MLKAVTNNSQKKRQRQKNRKHTVHDNESVPTDSQCIVQIVKPLGNHLYEVVNPTGEQYMASLYQYRKTIWVKRGDYVLTDCIEKADKVKAEIVKRLTENDIKDYRKQNCWPLQFESPESNVASEKESLTENNKIGYDLPVNQNRVESIYNNNKRDNSDNEENKSGSEWFACDKLNCDLSDYIRSSIYNSSDVNS